MIGGKPNAKRAFSPIPGNVDFIRKLKNNTLELTEPGIEPGTTCRKRGHRTTGEQCRNLNLNFICNGLKNCFRYNLLIVHISHKSQKSFYWTGLIRMWKDIGTGEHWDWHFATRLIRLFGWWYQESSQPACLYRVACIDLWFRPLSCRPPGSLCPPLKGFGVIICICMYKRV